MNESTGSASIPPVRCAWAGTDPPMVEYHDREWGVPLYDDRRLFELLMLEGAQAGLSWSTILKKREGYRAAFRGFDPAVVATFGPAKIESLLASPAIVRNRLKIMAVITNAQALLGLVSETGSFSRYLWSFACGRPIQTMRDASQPIAARTDESTAMSHALVRCGFKFVGPTICYAFMQSAGMVNDHVVQCFRHGAVQADVT